MDDKELLATKIEGNYKSPLKNCNCYNRKLKKLQSNWNSLREYIKNKDNWYYDIDCSGDNRYIFMNINDVLDKMNELEGVDNENN